MPDLIIPTPRPRRQPAIVPKITRRTVRDFLADVRPYQPGLQADLDLVDLIRAAMVFGAGIQRERETPTFVKVTRPAPPQETPDYPRCRCDMDRAYLDEINASGGSMNLLERTCWMGACGRLGGRR